MDDSVLATFKFLAEEDAAIIEELEQENKILRAKVAAVEALEQHTCMWHSTGIWGSGYSPTEVHAALATGEA